MNVDKDGFDLLRWRSVRALILWRGFPYVFQILILCLFLLLIAAGWGVYTPEGVNDKLYAKCNLVTLIIWGLWWPAMIWITVFLGRAWCMVCPLELVSSLCERLSQRIGIGQRRLQRWITSGVIIVVLFAVLQFLVPAAHLHRTPAYTSWFMLILLIMAVVVGLFFKDRAFCRGFCPVGLFLSVYGRGGMLVVRAGSKQACQGCAGKECFKPSKSGKFDGRSCPSLLNPPKLNSNRDCLICGQCIKACRPDNMKLLLRRPFYPNDLRESTASWPTTLFVMLISGFVIYELCTEWAVAKGVFLAVPGWISGQINIAWLSGYIQGVWTLMVVPLLLWLFLGMVMRLSGRNSSIGLIWRRMALPIAVVIAAGHMVKALAKVNSWAGYFPYAYKDPAAVKTAMDFQVGVLDKPGAFLPMLIVTLVGIIILVTGCIYALREARLTDPVFRYRNLLPISVFTILFVFIVGLWTLNG